MPLVDIQLIKGVFTPDQKQSLITRVTDAVVSVEGESMRGGSPGFACRRPKAASGRSAANR